jgi:hypothetical protein
MVASRTRRGRNNQKLRALVFHDVRRIRLDSPARPRVYKIHAAGRVVSLYREYTDVRTAPPSRRYKLQTAALKE